MGCHQSSDARNIFRLNPPPISQQNFFRRYLFPLSTVTEVRGIEDHALMPDYNLEYRKLREAGFSGWSGANRDGNIRILTTTLMWLEAE